MKPHRLLTALLLAAGLLAGASAQSVRPEVGKPLQQAGDLLRAGKAKEALAQVRQLQTCLMAQSGDFSGVAKEAAAAVAAAEQAGRRPAEDDLLRLADAQQRTKNAAGQANTMEKLLANYPKKEYWNDMLVRIQRKPGFSADRLALDVYRLQLATGNLTKTNDYMEMAQLALQAGNTAEAKKIVDKGFAANLL